MHLIFSQVLLLGGVCAMLKLFLGESEVSELLDFQASIPILY